MRRMLLVLAVVCLASGTVLALTKAQESLSSLCDNIRTLLPMVALLMLIIAGAVYAAGQVMGAETRARANVWSTAMLVGAIIGLIMGASAKFLVGTFMQFSLGSESALTGTEWENFCTGTGSTT